MNYVPLIIASLAVLTILILLAVRLFRARKEPRFRGIWRAGDTIWVNGREARIASVESHTAVMVVVRDEQGTHLRRLTG